MPVIDERLLEPDGKPEIAENFNRVMAGISGAGRLFPYSPQPGDFTTNAIGIPEYLVPMDLSAYREIEASETGAFWKAISIEYDSEATDYKIKTVNNIAESLGMSGMQAFLFGETLLMTFGCKITGVTGNEKLSAEAYEGFGFYLLDAFPDYAIVILSLQSHVMA